MQLLLSTCAICSRTSRLIRIPKRPCSKQATAATRKSQASYHGQRQHNRNQVRLVGVPSFRLCWVDPFHHWPCGWVPLHGHMPWLASAVGLGSGSNRTGHQLLHSRKPCCCALALHSSRYAKAHVVIRRIGSGPWCMIHIIRACCFHANCAAQRLLSCSPYWLVMRTAFKEVVLH